MTLTVGTLATVCFALLAMGYVLFLILGRVPSKAKAISAVWPVLWIETLIVAVVAGALWLGGWVLVAVLIAHAFRTAWEAAHVATKRAELTPPLIYAANIVFLSILLSFAPLSIVAPLTAAAFLACLLLRRLASDERARVALDLTLFPGIPLILFTAVGLQGDQSAWFLLAFMLVEVFDSYALVGGKLFGRTKAFPTLSPNKTVEGLACGAAILMLTAAIGAAIFGASIGGAILLAAFIAPFAVAGDLAASRLKRLSFVKDFPKFLPHQGGLLDTTDAWIAVVAALVVASQIFTG